MHYEPWPAELPQTPISQGFEEADNDGYAEFVPDDGPPKRRLRSTAGTSTVSARFLLSWSLRRTLLEFWRESLARGTLPFTAPGTLILDEVTDAVDLLFISAPKFEQAGPRWWVNCSFMRLP